MASAKAGSVAEYIAAADPKARPMLMALRAAIRKAVPKAEEKISYGVPLYKLNGMLCAFGAAKKHVGFYSMSKTFLDKHGKGLLKYQASVGTLQFPLGTKIPSAAITKAVKARAKMNEEKKKKG